MSELGATIAKSLPPHAEVLSWAAALLIGLFFWTIMEAIDRMGRK